MTIHIPLLFNTLKPNQMKLAKCIADAIYPYNDVYIRNWDNFLSKFNFLTETSNFSITAVDSEDVTTSFINLKPVCVSINFNCDDKMITYLKDLTNNIIPEDKFIGVTPPINIGSSGVNYTSFFITEININPVKLFGDGVPLFSNTIVEIEGYTFYKTNINESIEFYEEDGSYD